MLEQRGIGYVFAIGRDFQITTSGHQKTRADAVLGLVEPHGWNRRSARNGSATFSHWPGTARWPRLSS